MAIKGTVAIKAALDLAVVQINVALEDTVQSGEIAGPLSRPEHPLRDLNQLFVIDPITGQFSTDDTYVDGAAPGNPGIKTRKNQIVLDSLT